MIAGNMLKDIVKTTDRQNLAATAGGGGFVARGSPTTRAQIIQGRERAMARRVARNSLMDACNQALFHLLSGLGRADSPEKVRIGLLASEMLREEVDATRSRLSRGGTPDALMFD
jgi:hypothetical protein